MSWEYCILDIIYPIKSIPFCLNPSRVLKPKEKTKEDQAKYLTQQNNENNDPTLPRSFSVVITKFDSTRPPCVQAYHPTKIFSISEEVSVRRRCRRKRRSKFQFRVDFFLSAFSIENAMVHCIWVSSFRICDGVVASAAFRVLLRFV